MKTVEIKKECIEIERYGLKAKELSNRVCYDDNFATKVDGLGSDDCDQCTGYKEVEFEKTAQKAYFGSFVPENP